MDPTDAENQVKTLFFGGSNRWFLREIYHVPMCTVKLDGPIDDS